MTTIRCPCARLNKLINIHTFAEQAASGRTGPYFQGNDVSDKYSADKDCLICAGKLTVGLVKINGTNYISCTTCNAAWPPSLTKAYDTCPRCKTPHVFDLK